MRHPPLIRGAPIDEVRGSSRVKRSAKVGPPLTLTVQGRTQLDSRVTHLFHLGLASPLGSPADATPQRPLNPARAVFVTVILGHSNVITTLLLPRCADHAI